MTEQVGAAETWSAVAQAWDRHVDDVDDHTAAATVALFDRAAVQAGDRVLELAAGPGSLGASWSARVGPTGSVVLSDVAPGMVEVAATRNTGSDNVMVDQLDASAIDRPDGTFDVVACRMGLMFAPDPFVALAEMHRVLAPSGRLVVLTWAGVEHNPWMTCVGMAAMMNGVVSGGPPVGPGGIFSLGDPAELERLAKGAGFVDVVVEEIAVAFEVDSVDAHVARVASLAGPMASAFAAATPEQLDAVRRTAADLVAPHATEEGYTIPGRVLVLSGRRQDD